MSDNTETPELEAAIVPEIFQPLPLVDLYNGWKDKEQYSSLCEAEHEAASEKVGLTRALSQQRSIRDSFVKVCPANRRSIHLLGLPESDYHVLLKLLSVIRPEYQKIHSVINDLRALVTDTAAKQESVVKALVAVGS